MASTKSLIKNSLKFYRPKRHDDTYFTIDDTYYNQDTSYRFTVKRSDGHKFDMKVSDFVKHIRNGEYKIMENNMEKKPIEFLYSVETNLTDNRKPSSYKPILQPFDYYKIKHIYKAVRHDDLDVMIAFKTKEDENDMYGVIYFGHWNDGVI